jgi:flavin-dependent dehydrogenase
VIERGAAAEDFDVVVVGARCAGSPLATLLARRGLRVCVLDRSRFPSETLSTHVIQPRGVAVLDRLGVLEAVFAAGAVPLTRFTLISDEVRLSTAVDPAAFEAPSLSARRIVLDELLVEAAIAAGAEVRTGTAVTGLLWEDGRVAGVETGQGQVRARLVVGADGRHSTVARLVGAGEYDVAPPGRLFAWAYFAGVTGGEGHLRLGSIGELNYVAGPTDGGLHMAAVCPPLANRDAFLADRERGFMAGIAAWPELADLLAGAERDGPIRLLTSWHGYFRQAAGPGWALLGDAGNFKDPSPAQGMADAFVQAEQMADAVVAGLGGGSELDEGLRHWWRRRDEEAREMHWFAADMGAARPAGPIAHRVMSDLATDEQGSTLLLRVLNREISPAQMATPRRIVGAALRVARDRPGQIPTMAKEAAMELGKEIRRAPGQTRERVLLALTIVGFVVPNAFVAAFLIDEGFELGRYFSLWTASLPSTQLLFDLGIAAVAFLLWAAWEGRRSRVERWWLCIPATFLVGLCFGLPLFLWMRERSLRDGGVSA